MGRPSGAHTHPPSGGVIAVAVLGGVALAVIASHKAGPALASAGRGLGELVRLALIAGVVTVALAVVIATAIVLRARRRPARRPSWRVTAEVVPPASLTTSLPALADRPAMDAGQPAIEARPAEVHHHHHWAGVSAATLAEAFGHMRAPEQDAPAHVRAPDA